MMIKLLAFECPQRSGGRRDSSGGRALWATVFCALAWFVILMLLYRAWQS
jgi:hypothetical protein